MKINFDIPQSVRDELTGAQIEALEAVYRFRPGTPNSIDFRHCRAVRRCRILNQLQ